LLVTHIARVWAPPPWPETILLHYAFIPARYSSAAVQGLPPASLFELIANFVTYMFLHGNFAHVAINCLWLLAFGPLVARRLKPARFVLFFVFCGVVSAATHLAAYWGAAEEVVGASGAISGLMAAAMRIMYGRLYYPGDAEPRQRARLAPILSKPIIGFTVLWVITNVLGGVTGLGLTDDATVIAWVAHLGGYFAGLFAIDFFDRSSQSAPEVRPSLPTDS
jgi:membrane associated rhomboid family serine protease